MTNNNSEAEIAFAAAVKGGDIPQKSANDPTVKMQWCEAYSRTLLEERKRCSAIVEAGYAAGRSKLAGMHIEAGTSVEAACLDIGPALAPHLLGGNLDLNRDGPPSDRNPLIDGGNVGSDEMFGSSS